MLSHDDDGHHDHDHDLDHGHDDYYDHDDDHDHDHPYGHILQDLGQCVKFWLSHTYLLQLSDHGHDRP